VPIRIKPGRSVRCRRKPAARQSIYSLPERDLVVPLHAIEGQGQTGKNRSTMNRSTLLLLIGSGVLGAAVLWWSIRMSTAIDAPMSSSGWAAMFAGIVVTFALGVALMSLVFLSSRRGYDKPPDQIVKKERTDKIEQQDPK
jgi:hypothetical protein